MGLVDSIRARQADIRAQNPADISINRITRTKNDYGGYDDGIPAILDPQEVRIYIRYNESPDIVAEIGHTKRRTGKLIASYDADILGITATNEDSFSYAGNTWIVKDVVTRNIAGEAIFKEAYIEEKV